MRTCELKKQDWWRWGHNSAVATHSCAGGYLKRCRDCGQRIYVKCDYDGVWRPYESYIEGNVEPREWVLHDCDG